MCSHRLCELVGDGTCSLATRRSRGCRPNLAAPAIDPAIFAEARALLVAIEGGDRAAAVRLAQIIRREALDDRNFVALARDEDPALGDSLAALCVRRDR